MPASQRNGGGDELARFRRLAVIAIAITFPLIVIGGIVRVSGAGLGCGQAGSGIHGWPLCEGTVLPLIGGISGETAIEFAHRVIAAVVGVLVALLVWRAWRQLREHRYLVWGSTATGILVLTQAILGGLTVEHNLEPVLVAAHLGLAMVMLAALTSLERHARHVLGDHSRISSASRPGMRGGSRGPGLASDQGISSASPAGMPGMLRSRSIGEASRSSGPWLRMVAILAALLVLATIVSGGYVAGTEGEGAEGRPAAGAHLACGKQFPTCAGQGVLPFGHHPLIDAQLTHRLLMFLASIAVIAMIVAALARGVRHWALPAAGAVLAGQVLLGALNVWLGKHAGLIVAHLTLGTILWTVVVYATMALIASRAPAPKPRPHPGSAEPATVTG